jgi:hypothetical protein
MRRRGAGISTSKMTQVLHHIQRKSVRWNRLTDSRNSTEGIFACGDRAINLVEHPFRSRPPSRVRGEGQSSERTWTKYAPHVSGACPFREARNLVFEPPPSHHRSHRDGVDSHRIAEARVRLVPRFNLKRIIPPGRAGWIAALSPIASVQAANAEIGFARPEDRSYLSLVSSGTHFPSRATQVS